MMQLINRWTCGLLLVAGVQSASAFSLLGPLNEYQAPPNGVFLSYPQGDDIGGPKNLGEEYRYALPVLHYAFDSTFLDYFGASGVAAVEEAIAILNALQPVSSYSLDLSEFPLEAQSTHFPAQGLRLLDLRSVALAMLVEQLGLACPDCYTWTLRNRVPLQASPPPHTHTVIKRNFDPVTREPSTFVNGTMLSYFISDNAPFSDAVEFPVDPLASTFTAVASGADGASRFGAYYTGLTRDDVGGLRYLYSSTNLNVERAPPGSVLFVTNSAARQLLVTSNLAAFSEQSFSNSAANLQALYPQLIISSTELVFVNVITTNAFAYFTNKPFAPAGTASLVIATNYTTNAEARYLHTFANLVTNNAYTVGVVTEQETRVEPKPFAPAGTIWTNVINRTISENFVNGDYFIIPTNLCGYRIIATQLVSQVIITNNTFVATNAASVTNIVNPVQFSRSILTYYNSYSLIVDPVVCPTNTTALRQGVEKITFVRKNYDSLLGRFFEPVTNQYTLFAVTNFTVIPQHFQRVITQPDILFTAADAGTTFIADRSIIYTNSPLGLLGLAGPGTIEPPARFTFNKVGPIFSNPIGNGAFIFPLFQDETTHGLQYIWGSFNGTTNGPVIYPSGASIAELEAQVLTPPPP